jgi:hypothetical protein
MSDLREQKQRADCFHILTHSMANLSTYKFGLSCGTEGEKNAYSSGRQRSDIGVKGRKEGEMRERKQNSKKFLYRRYQFSLGSC